MKPPQNKALKKKYTLIFRVLLCFTLGSCVTYNPPPVKTPKATSWKNQTPTDKPLTECPESSMVFNVPLAPWWTVFNDEILNELEEKAIKQSPTIQNAVAKLEELQALYGVIRSEQFPQLNLSASYERQRFPVDSGVISQSQQTTSSSTTPTSPAPVPGGTSPTSSSASTTAAATVPSSAAPAQAFPRHLTTLSVLPTVTYEVDFWGQYWQQAASAFSRYEASAEDLRTALLMLTTNLADQYYQLRSLDNELFVLEKTYTSRKNAYDINEARYEAGIINALDALQAKVELADVEQDMENSKRLRAVSEDAIAVLIGEPASNFHLERKSVALKLPVIPPGIPSVTMQNRPDVRQAEILIEAQRLNVGVAKTAFFPAFTLNGYYGFQSDKAHTLFKWRNHVWDFTCAMVTPIFDAGQNYYNLKQAKAIYKEAVANFCDKVISAYGEIEDALFSVESRKKQVFFLKEEVKAAYEALNIANIRYRNGLIGYLDVIVLEKTALNSERQEVQTTKDEVSSIIQLIKSLGGSWTDVPKNPIIEEKPLDPLPPPADFP